MLSLFDVAELCEEADAASLAHRTGNLDCLDVRMAGEHSARIVQRSSVRGAISFVLHTFPSEPFSDGSFMTPKMYKKLRKLFSNPGCIGHTSVISIAAFLKHWAKKVAPHNRVQVRKFDARQNGAAVYGQF